MASPAPKLDPRNQQLFAEHARRMNKIDEDHKEFMNTAERCEEILQGMGDRIERARGQQADLMRRVQQRSIFDDFFCLRSLDNGLTLVFNNTGVAIRTINTCTLNTFNALTIAVKPGLQRHKKVIWIVGLMLLGIAAYRFWKVVLDQKVAFTEMFPFNYLRQFKAIGGSKP